MFECGWVSCEGEVVECTSFEHLSKAAEIVDERYMVKTYRPDDFLLYNGWVKVQKGEWYGDFRRITDKTVDLVNCMGIKPDDMMIAHSGTVRVGEYSRNKNKEDVCVCKRGKVKSVSISYELESSEIVTSSLSGYMADKFCPLCGDRFVEEKR